MCYAKRRRTGDKPRVGFLGYGRSEDNMKAMCERFMVKLTTAHHGQMFNSDTTLSMKQRASAAIRELANFLHCPTIHHCEPTDEMLRICKSIEQTNYYPELVARVEGLLIRVRRYRQVLRSTEESTFDN